MEDWVEGYIKDHMRNSNGMKLGMTMILELKKVDILSGTRTLWWILWRRQQEDKALDKINSTKNFPKSQVSSISSFQNKMSGLVGQSYFRFQNKTSSLDSLNFMGELQSNANKEETGTRKDLLPRERIKQALEASPIYLSQGEPYSKQH
ncbi:hypothetical protein M9H77_16704 [Catharanthus roseus]|uniref:Uncharacterized protein n=1 Tax=Catharanthus roseus TaxID=4058 RepID=A0ACC0B2I5_CATRO|nr:hypothetical protein M9H77_16704 [Catharanthus roseus]